MDLRAHSFRCFVLLAEEGSFTRAAERVGLTQSALSMRIRDMERQLGLKLFHRSSRTVEITSEGSELLDQARRILTETDRFATLTETLRSRPEAPITIALPVTPAGTEIWMDLLDRFRALEPKAEVRTLRHATADIVAAVESGRADIGFVAGRPETDLPCLVLSRRPIQLAIPEEWPLAARNRIVPADLQALRVASFDRAINPGLFDQTLGLLKAAGAELVDAPEGIIGAGFAARARLAMPSLQWGPEPSAADRMRWVSVEGIDLKLDLCLVRAAEASRRAVRRFWEVARKQAVSPIDQQS